MNKIALTMRMLKAGLAYKRGMTKLNYLPLRLWIEPTNICNYRCVTCPQSTGKFKLPRGYMSLELYNKIISEACEFANDILLFISGESLLHKDIAQMISSAKAKGLKVQINTNASVLTTDIANAVIEAGLDRIVFSFNGYDKTGYEKVMGAGNYDTALANIRSFLDMRRKSGTKTPYAVIQIVESEANTADAKTQHNFKNQFNKTDIRFKVIKAHSFGGRFGVVNNKKLSYSPCTFLWYSMSILYNGIVVPCCVDVDGEMTLENVQKKSLKEIWNSEAMIKLRGKMLNKDINSYNLCSNCDILWKHKVLGIPTRYIWGYIKENFLQV